ncbi:BatD family protein [Algoriphagus aquimarinus]|uniref:Oxygen tolerance n=1 Tax=Algoriphagus aquimarinus TaxID=237018 RepID=A0A1I1BKL0_9BACT|nr:BatD family protein [Algoriphagus aquimarinus]SFB48963.1 Oxygen tolerance [Algoriphagus aquimarinus]|tara:strand:+ start:153444 stop:154892 length:1449 start_codon:yes stop_codon:yes gene_type:complete
MIKTLAQFIFVCGLFLISGWAIAQDVQIELGPAEIGLNETFTIKVTLSNEKIKSYDQFPEIPSFQKQGISQSSSMNLINGQMSSSNSIIQYYKPSRKGEFTLPSFELNINGQAYSSVGKKITVGDAASANSGNNNLSDPFADFFGRSAVEDPEYVEMDDDAFFSISVDKEEVYQGEGINISLAFYMSESNQAQFNFYEPGRQLDDILKKIKPTNAWEENFNISNIDPEQVTINGKRWTKFKVYEATFFPFSEGELVIPRIPWEMIKYKIAKNPTFFGANRQEDFKTFYSNSKTIKVKPLPPHPLKNEVSVGQFQIRENIKNIEVETGQGFDYNFGISGVGNINAVSAPKRLPIANLNTYDPNVRQQINRGYGRVSGIKEFNYYITINEAGEVDLGKNFEWVYFDPERAVYDTLRPQAKITVVGESKVNQAISSQRLGGLYDRISTEDNRFLNEKYKYYFTVSINVLLLLAVALLAVLIIRKR